MPKNHTYINNCGVSVRTLKVVLKVEETSVLLEHAAVVVHGEVGSGDHKSELVVHNAEVEVRLLS